MRYCTNLGNNITIINCNISMLLYALHNLQFFTLDRKKTTLFFPLFVCATINFFHLMCLKEENGEVIYSF